MTTLTTLIMINVTSMYMLFALGAVIATRCTARPPDSVDHRQQS
ncbi:hypothetical protein [Rhodococcus sp. UNC23MFCrub1.1]|nr:hypothetical protein [Rhodococcus sp. UNC23MFCrub1.1]